MASFDEYRRSCGLVNIAGPLLDGLFIGMYLLAGPANHQAKGDYYGVETALYEDLWKAG